MIYPVNVYGDPILRKKAQPVEKGQEGFEEFLENMWETMYYADGVGLAAPQIGKSLRVFVVDASSGAEEEPELKDFKKAFINPEIIETNGEKWSMNEGCLFVTLMKILWSTLKHLKDTPAGLSNTNTTTWKESFLLII